MNKINAEKTKDMVIIGLMAAIICVMGRCQSGCRLHWYRFR